MNTPSEAPAEPKPNQRTAAAILFAMVAIALGVTVYQPLVESDDPKPLPSCIESLKTIDGAIMQWGLEYKKTATDTYSLTDPVLLMYLRHSRMPQCPEGGIYTSGTNLMDGPKCSLGTHDPGHRL